MFELHAVCLHEEPPEGEVTDAKHNKLEWTINTKAVYKGLSRLYFPRRLGSLRDQMLQMFYESVVASTIFFAVVSWGAGIKAKDANRLNKLIKKAGSVVDWRRWQNCWWSWTMSLTPSTKLRTSLRAASAANPFNPATLKNGTGNHSYLVPLDCTTPHSNANNT